MDISMGSWGSGITMIYTACLPAKKESRTSSGSKERAFSYRADAISLLRLSLTPPARRRPSWTRLLVVFFSSVIHSV